MERIIVSTPKGVKIEATLLGKVADTEIIYAQNRIALVKQGIITDTLVDYCLCPDIDLEWEK